MFSKKVFTGTKRALAVFLATCMMVGMFTCLSFVTVLTAVADEPVATETAVFIGKTGAEKQAAAFIPVDIADPDSPTDNLFEGEVYFQVSFKCKMLSGSKPVVGVYDLDDSNNKSWARADWCDQNSVVVNDGVCTAMIKVNFHRHANPNDQGYRSFYLVIGNSYYNGSSTEYGDFESSFIISDVKLFMYDEEEGELVYDDEKDEYTNYLPEFTASNINFKGTYFFKTNGSDNWDALLGADAMKWHVLAAPAYVKQITVPSDYNTSDNYAAANFEKTAETELTREYYTNANYEGKYFAVLKNSNDAGFEIISSDVNKKMVIIDANHEGEEDYNLGTGNEKAPKYNRAANIFLPISYGQYAMTGSTAQDISFLVKITFKAVRLEGDSAPVIGRIVGKKSNTSGRGSQALCKAAYNIPIGDYTDNAETYNETYKDAEGNRLKCEYNAETGDFTGWMRVLAADNSYASRWGVNEIITIGNAEHVWEEGTFDSTSFNSSFAISNIKVDLYECGSGYVRGNLVAEDIAPSLTADTLDTTSRWAYQFRRETSYQASNNDYDCIRAPQNLWSAEGNVGMVHSVDLTDCMANGHTVTHHAATDNLREYWSCSCGKYFAESYCATEITDLTAKKQIMYIAPSEQPANVFIPIKLSGFENHQWFKFTCKCKLIDGESIPVVSTLYNEYYGQNAYVTTKPGDDMAVQEYSYDPETYTLTAYIYGWIRDTINRKDKYPFERMNAISGANIAIVIGNGRYIGDGYTEANKDTGFELAEPELYMVDCTDDVSALETAKAAVVTSGNLITNMTDKTIDLESNYIPQQTHPANLLSAPQYHWYITGSDKANISTKDLPANYFVADYVPCAHEHTTYHAAVPSTCVEQGVGAYTICDDCGEIIEGSNAPLPLDPNNHVEIDEDYAQENTVPASCTTDGGYDKVYYCFYCGEPGRVEHVTWPAKGHTADEEWHTDGTSHWHECTVCHEKVDEAVHTGGTATCTAKAVCEICGAEYGEVNPDAHTLGDWLSDEANHWKVCSECSGEVDKAAHTESDWIIDTPATVEAGGHRHKECTVCGYHTVEEDTEPLAAGHTPGDINNDGKVNNKDLTRLFQKLSGWDVEVNEEALDINGDGKVNNKDLTRLFQKLSGWDVEIF